MKDPRYLDIYKDYERKVRSLEGDSKIDFILQSSNILFDSSIDSVEKIHDYKKLCGMDNRKEAKTLSNKYSKKDSTVYLAPKTAYVYAPVNYKRSNYFKDNLNRLLNKDRKVIDVDIVNDIEKSMKKFKIAPEELDYEKCRLILRRMKKPEYYKHIHSIMYQLQHVDINITDTTMKEIHALFDIIQDSYELYRSKQKHFLSYKYTLYKILELLGHDAILKLFPSPILKNRDIIYDHDNCWKKICNDHGLIYYPTLSFYE